MFFNQTPNKLLTSLNDIRNLGHDFHQQVRMWKRKWYGELIKLHNIWKSDLSRHINISKTLVETCDSVQKSVSWTLTSSQSCHQCQLERESKSKNLYWKLYGRSEVAVSNALSGWPMALSSWGNSKNLCCEIQRMGQQDQGRSLSGRYTLSSFWFPIVQEYCL